MSDRPFLGRRRQPNQKIREAMKAHMWKPGQSGNPSGRTKFSRNKFSDHFLEALMNDFVVHGADAIVKVRETKPDQYLRVIASVLPRELHIKDTTLDDLNDDELLDYAVAVRTFLAGTPGRGKPGVMAAGRGAKAKKDPEPEGRLN